MSIQELLAATTRPDRSLFFARGDPDDPRMGEHVFVMPEDYAAAQVVLLGCPQDEGVRRNGGRPGAAAGPHAIRDRLYRLVAIAGLRLFDLGNTNIQGTLEATHDLQRAIMAQLVRDGKRVVSLGGGNDIAYPDCAGMFDALADADGLAFNVDAHFDVRADTPRNSGTPYRMLLDQGILSPQAFWQIGHQPFAVAEAHRRYLDERGVAVRSLVEWRAAGVEASLAAILAASRCRAIFWGLDLDVVRAADAPGVSAPNSGGLSAEEIMVVAALAGRDPRSCILELSELNPAYDLDMRTSRLAAGIVWHFLCGVAAILGPSRQVDKRHPVA
jgi:formiminoglutamase